MITDLFANLFIKTKIKQNFTCERFLQRHNFFKS
jgi:hypothetical protein